MELEVYIGKNINIRACPLAIIFAGFPENLSISRYDLAIFLELFKMPVDIGGSENSDVQEKLIRTRCFFFYR